MRNRTASGTLCLALHPFNQEMIPSAKAHHFLAAFALLGALTGCNQAATTNSTTASPAASPPSVNKPVSQTPGNCFIHDQKRSPSTLSFLGWAVGNPTEAPQSITVTVSNGGKTSEFAVKYYDRPDIAKAYNSPSLLKTGFIASIPAGNAPAGSQLSVMIEGSSERYRCKNIFKAI